MNKMYEYITYCKSCHAEASMWIDENQGPVDQVMECETCQSMIVLHREEIILSLVSRKTKNNRSLEAMGV